MRTKSETEAYNAFNDWSFELYKLNMSGSLLSSLMSNLDTFYVPRDGGYYQSYHDLWRREDFVFGFHGHVGCSRLLGDVYAVLTRGSSVPPIRDAQFTTLKTSDCEIKHIARFHSGGIWIEGPWWDEFKDSFIPSFWNDYNKAMALIADAKLKKEKELEFEEMRQKKLWQAK